MKFVALLTNKKLLRMNGKTMTLVIYKKLGQFFYLSFSFLFPFLVCLKKDISSVKSYTYLNKLSVKTIVLAFYYYYFFKKAMYMCRISI